jgi:thiol-disulfide isomerase/thioredoxin
VDSSGKEVKLDLSKSNITVIDFWFNTCPPCIEDMNRFSKLIKGKDESIRVISASINNFNLWRGLFSSSDKRFSVLSETVANWTHVVLKSNEDPALKNSIPSDNLELLERSFQSHSFPMYFVLDKNGIIKETPFSLSKYIEVKTLERHPFSYFLTNRKTWTTDYFLVPFSFLTYSVCFWIIACLVLWLLSARKKAPRLT